MQRPNVWVVEDDDLCREIVEDALGARHDLRSFGTVGDFEEAARLPADQPPIVVSGGVPQRVRWEILNQIAMMLLAPLYPHYRRHRSHHPLAEMCGLLKRLAKRPFERRYAERLSRYLEESRPEYYLLPLQLETDYQIRRHSRFKSMAHVM